MDLDLDLDLDMEPILTVAMVMAGTRSVHMEATIRTEDMVAILIQHTDTRDTVITADSVHVINSNIKRQSSPFFIALFFMLLTH